MAMRARSWDEVKAEAHRLNPRLADPQLEAEAEAELDAYITGYQLQELRKSLGMTQAEVAKLLNITQPRVSQIENGEVGALELDTLRAYAAALGGHLNVTIDIGARSVKVA